MGRVRKGAPEWTETSSVPSDKNKVKCSHFGIEVSAKIERNRIHLNKYSKRHKNSTPIKIQNNSSITSPLENNESTSAANSEKQKNNEVSVSTSTVSFKRRINVV